MANPFSFLECKRELDSEMAPTSPFGCGSLVLQPGREKEWGMGSGGGGRGVLCTLCKWIGSVLFSCVSCQAGGTDVGGNRCAC